MACRYLQGVWHEQETHHVIPRTLCCRNQACEAASAAHLDTGRISGSRELGETSLEVGRAEVTLATIILTMLFPAQPAPKPPHGLLDCGFERGVYACRPEESNGNK